MFNSFLNYVATNNKKKLCLKNGKKNIKPKEIGKKIYKLFFRFILLL